jgi:hypothetical protein
MVVEEFSEGGFLPSSVLRMILFKLSFALVLLSLGFVAPADARPIIAISAGSSSTIGSFLSDRDFNGGSPFSTNIAVDTSHAVNPALPATYQSCRYGQNFSYVIPGLDPGAEYLVRLHFSEVYFTAPGSRVFNVSFGGGTPVLNNFDIVGATGGRGVATVREFMATANISGNISIEFSGVVENAIVSGIEIVSGDGPHPIPSPSYNVVLSADQTSYTAGSTATILVTTRNEPLNSNVEFFVSSTFAGADVPLNRITDSQSYGITPPLAVGSQLFLANLFVQDKIAAKALNDAIGYYVSEIIRLNLALSGTTDANQIAAIQAEIARDQALLNSSQAQLAKIRTPLGQPVSLVISTH